MRAPAVSAAQQVRAYLAALPADVRAVATAIRDAIRAAAPKAEEHFSYGMPGFRLDGQVLVWYAAWKKHVGLYPIGPAIAKAAAKGTDYAAERGTLRFPLTKPPTAALVKRLVKARMAELRTRPEP